MRASTVASTKGTGLVEVSLGALLLSVALGCAGGLLRLSQGMAPVADSATALSEAAMAMAALRKDLLEQVPDPASGSGGDLEVTTSSIRFSRAVLSSSGELEYRSVWLGSTPAAGGRVLLVRRSGDREEILPGRYSRIRFHLPAGPGSDLLRISLHLFQPPTFHGSRTRNPPEDLVISSIMYLARSLSMGPPREEI